MIRISYKWLSDYFKDSLPPAEKLAETLSLKAYEAEVDGDVLEIDVLPNRTHDSLSYIGVAKEIAVLLDQELKLPEINYKKDSSQKTSDFINLKVDDHKLVTRAMKRIVLDVKVGESPAWLKEKLASMGQKSINNIVDITNFVMWETGQPVHAFDLDKVKKDVTIRSAEEGEKVTTLDGVEYSLKEGMLVISDSDKALDIAGIKGGAVSGIDENTKNIMLSICNFNPTWIRKTSRALGLRTEASLRFEHGLSPYMTEGAMERLSQLISELAGGKVLEEVLDSYPKERVRTSAPYKIGVSLSEVNKVLGSQMSEKDVEEILNRFQKYAGFKWGKVNSLEKILEEAQKYEGVPYKYGASVTFDAPNYFDCSSFVNFVFVQAGVALPRMTVDQYVYGHEINKNDLMPGDLVFSRNESSDEEHVERLGKQQKTLHKESKEFMRGTEVPDGLDHNGIYLGDEKVVHAAGNWHLGKIAIENISESPAFNNIVGYKRIMQGDEERYVMEIPPERLDLRAGPGFMISGNKEDLIEEIGRVYGYENIKSTLPKALQPKVNKTFYYTEKLKDLLVSEGFSEVVTYSLRGKGEVKLANPLSADKKYLRDGLVDGLKEALEFNKKNAPLLGLNKVKIFEIGKVFGKESETLSVGLASEDTLLLKDLKSKLEGVIGKTKSEEKDGVLVMEVNEDKLPEIDSYKDLSFEPTNIKEFEEISSYPFVLRDIALWVPNKVESLKVEKSIKENAGELLKNIRLFDTYEKEGKTSYAFSLVFQSNKRTLTDNEVNEVMDKVYQAVRENGWEPR